MPELDDREATPPAPERVALDHVLERFTAAPAVTVGEAEQDLCQAREEVAGLRAGMRTRTVIGQATGLLMARFNLTAEDAFTALLRTSSHANRKLRDLAAEIVDEANAAASPCGCSVPVIRLPSNPGWPNLPSGEIPNDREP